MSVGLAVEITIEDRSLKYEAYKCIASIDIIPTILGQRSLRCDCPNPSRNILRRPHKVESAQISMPF